ncbi:hypothetical protein IVA98_20270 [Bradyrhizobium sp. 160]|uniref:hypothetical protein n=1 Tax=Bradyrhizobium sp. 160 TaxID=2782634 RepID=UPI001FF81C88|nr:hypothetical protein [Bradyrhizobium sp. 160]MCK1625456.1 hypothetical protein [Bradyrhizobium sp. 160]
MSNHSRNFLFIRSILFSVTTKAVGFFVVFACLPLAALSLTVTEYAAFNFSMAATGAVAIIFSPIATTFVVRFAHLTSTDDVYMKRLAGGAFAIFATLAAILELPAIAVAYWLSPAGFKIPIACAAAAVVATTALSWVDAFRLGNRQDHISSAFGLANNITIILGFVLLFHYQRLNFEHVLGIYYLSPLCWASISLLQLLHSSGIRIHFAVGAEEWKRALLQARPNIINSISDYLKLYGASFIAFYASSAQGYAAFSTAQLFIARLTNPLSLLARPLIPAYVDASARADKEWIMWLKRLMGLLCLSGPLSACIASIAITLLRPSELRFGVLVLSGGELGWYLVSGVLLFSSTVTLMLLASIYLARREMGLFSGTCLLVNVLAIGIGGTLAYSSGPVAMLAALALGGTLSSLYLSWRFVSPTAQNGI